ncbi:MAG: hypothetical protein ACRD4C_08085 [Candidatus Acidiferrales bacterium]
MIQSAGVLKDKTAKLPVLFKPEYRITITHLSADEAALQFDTPAGRREDRRNIRRDAQLATLAKQILEDGTALAGQTGVGKILFSPTTITVAEGVYIHPGWFLPEHIQPWLAVLSADAIRTEAVQNNRAVILLNAGEPQEIAKVLLHEIGHHINFIVHQEAANRCISPEPYVLNIFNRGGFVTTLDSADSRDKPSVNEVFAELFAWWLLGRPLPKTLLDTVLATVNARSNQYRSSLYTFRAKYAGQIPA